MNTRLLRILRPLQHALPAGPGCLRVTVVALACSLTLSACTSPVAPSAKPAHFYETVRSDVEKFWTDFFSSHRLTYSRIAKMQLYDGRVDTGCGQADSQTDGPFYCPTDRGVYLESGVMDSALSKYSDFGSAVIVAHEIGHHVQNLLGFNASITLHELQADCLAGGWMKDASARRLLEVSDSLEAAGSLFNAGDPFASPWFFPGAHGSPQQRVEAFLIGFQSGAENCF
jgi:predicted metalloprotease